MSIRQPKPKQIRLPFNVPKPKKGIDAPVRVCGICRSADSRYTCPRCNVPYCSLACFQDPAHAQCSEPFYKDTVLSEIASDPRAQAEEKRAMMDMLRRFEEGAAEGEDALAALESDEEEEDELAKALNGVDLDNVDSNELLRLLPQEHRDAFLAAIKDPSSAAAHELLQSAIDGGEGEADQAPVPNVLPWWEVGPNDDDEQAFAPPPPDVPEDMMQGIKPPVGVGAKLIYNVVALCMAYIHTLLSLRLPSLAPPYLSAQSIPPQEAKDELASLLPFLADKSTVRYASARDAWGAVWEAIGAEVDGEGGVETLAFLLDKVTSLLHPPITTDPPRAYLVLSDMYRLYAAPKAGAALPRKVSFYVAAVAQLSRADWLNVAGEVKREAERLRAEIPEEAEETEEAVRAAVLMTPRV